MGAYLGAYFQHKMRYQLNCKGPVLVLDSHRLQTFKTKKPARFLVGFFSCPVRVTTSSANALNAHVSDVVGALSDRGTRICSPKPFAMQTQNARVISASFCVSVPPVHLATNRPLSDALRPAPSTRSDPKCKCRNRMQHSRGTRKSL